LRKSVLGDICEAVIGAIYLDGGHAAAAQFVERNWLERMRKPRRPLRDPKTVLQEWAQARGLPTPSYREICRTGPHHDPEFLVAVNLPEFSPAEGSGRSKRAAEQAAAAAMLSREGVQDGLENFAQDGVREGVQNIAQDGVKGGANEAKESVRKRRAKDDVANDEIKDGLNGGGAGNAAKAAAAS
jgi:flagellar biosynthesis/type III secretory pathway protein FliH